MTTYQYKGEYQRVTVEGITFNANQAAELTADQLKRLKASAFGQHMLDNGALIEVAKTKPNTTPDAKPEPKTEPKSELKPAPRAAKPTLKADA